MESSDDNIVTKDTFNNFFSEDGTLLDSVTADELIFEGNLSDVDVSYMTITKPIKLTGKEAILDGVTFVIASDNVAVDGFTLTHSDVYLFDAEGVNNISILNNAITFKALEEFDSYAIYANMVDNLKIINNTIAYVGTTEGGNFNNAIRAEKITNSDISGNTFDISLYATTAGYDKNYNSAYYSDGVVVIASENITFSDNSINAGYYNYSGAYDSINVLVFGNANYDMDWDTYETIYPNVCKNVIVENNIITANGHNFIYGISMAANDSSVNNNVLNIAADYHYADGITINGPSDNIIVENNKIDLNAPDVIYGIYAYQYMGPIDNMVYKNNTITGTSYATCGFEIVENNPTIADNTITLNGNHTTAMAINMVENGTISGNTIKSLGSNNGTTSTGDGMIHMESAGISVKGDTIISNNDVTSTAIGVNLILGGNIVLTDNKINVESNGLVDNYAVYAKDMDSLNMTGNTITFTGSTDGTIITNAVYIGGTDNTTISENKFDITVPSSYVPWKELPSGSGNWVAFPVSEGIVIDDCNDVEFDSNDVDLTYTDVLGSYDTIYAIAVKDSTLVTVTDNDIAANGNSYIYTIQINAEDFVIANNTIVSESDSYYANAIDVEGPANGIIESNVISVKSPVSAYGIYSGMNGQNVSTVITNNTISGDAYSVFGLSLGDVESVISDNNINLKGNYTTGIASKVANLTVTGNDIAAKGSNVGNESIWEQFGVETIGIKVASGNATISNNNIETTGDYAISMSNVGESTVSDNKLVANNVGKNAIKVDSNVAISGTTPEYKTILVASDFSKAYGASTKFSVKLLDENGNPVANKNVAATIKGKVLKATTDKNGVAKFTISLAVGSYTVKTAFAGDDVYGPKEISNKVVIKKATTKMTAKAKTFKAKTKTKKYAITLKANGKALKKVKVTIKVGKKTYKATTNSKGKATFKITKLTKKGKYTAKVKFAGNKSYKAVTKKVKITVKK